MNKNNEPIVTIKNVSKSFGFNEALKKIDLEIIPGKIIGLLGANGAGKSTLLRHMIGLLLPDKGTCHTFGVEAGKLGPLELARIGYVHQEGELINWMSVGKLIRFVSSHYSNWDEKLEQNYMKDFEVHADRKIGSLSPGERQKLAILLAIGFDSDLLILDEPAAALDPIMRQQFLDLLMNYIQEENRTIIISSHILSDVEKIIDHVLIMKEGTIVRDCSLDDLKEEFCRIKLTAVNGELPDPLPFTGILEQEQDTGQVILTINNMDQEELKNIVSELRCDVEVLPLSLEELYRIVVTMI